MKSDLKKLKELDETMTHRPWVSDGEITQWLGGKAPGCAVRYTDDGRGYDPVAMFHPHPYGPYQAAGGPNPVVDANGTAYLRTVLCDIIEDLEELERLRELSTKQAVELDDKDIDYLLARFDMTNPQLQRRIIAQFVIDRTAGLME